MHLLAVSAGGGLLVGVGIRLANGRRHEGTSFPLPSRNGIAPDRISPDQLSPFLARLEALEKRIALQTPALPADLKHEKVEVGRTSSRDELATHIAAVETKLRHELEQRHEERLDQLSNALEKRLTQRIAPIEAELENQRVAVNELRDCSLRTESSLQKLLEGIEKLVVAQTSSKASEILVP